MRAALCEMLLESKTFEMFSRRFRIFINHIYSLVMWFKGESRIWLASEFCNLPQNTIYVCDARVMREANILAMFRMRFLILSIICCCSIPHSITCSKNPANYSRISSKRIGIALCRTLRGCQYFCVHIWVRLAASVNIVFPLTHKQSAVSCRHIEKESVNIASRSSADAKRSTFHVRRRAILINQPSLSSIETNDAKIGKSFSNGKQLSRFKCCTKRHTAYHTITSPWVNLNGKSVTFRFGLNVRMYVLRFHSTILTF